MQLTKPLVCILWMCRQLYSCIVLFLLFDWPILKCLFLFAHRLIIAISPYPSKPLSKTSLICEYNEIHYFIFKIVFCVSVVF